jgi:hypothetical protein
METSFKASQLNGGVCYKVLTITHADLTDDDTSQAITLFTLGAGSKILGVEVKHSVAFSGGTINAMTVSVGNASSATAYTSAYDIYQAVLNTNLQETALFKAGTAAAVDVLATFTSTAGNLVAATAGSVDIKVLYLNVTTP